MQTHVHWVGDSIQPSHPLLPPSPPAFNLSQHQGLFQWVGFFIRWPKYKSFSFSISLSNEYSGLISFRIDWFDLFVVQGTLKSLLQHYISKASILLHSTFFMVQLSHPYMTTGKTIALTRQTFVSKVMSLVFEMLSRFVIALLTRSKCLLISWLQSPPVVIWKPKKIKSATVSIFPLPICPEVMGMDAMILVFWVPWGLFNWQVGQEETTCLIVVWKPVPLKDLSNNLWRAFSPKWVVACKELTNFHWRFPGRKKESLLLELPHMIFLKALAFSFKGLTFSIGRSFWQISLWN